MYKGFGESGYPLRPTDAGASGGAYTAFLFFSLCSIINSLTEHTKRKAATAKS